MKDICTTRSTRLHAAQAFVLILLILAIAGCTQNPASTTTPAPGIPNPASVHCAEQGGAIEIRTDAEGGQYGVCVFEDGSECDEWAFYRGECKPGDNPKS